MDLPHPGPPAPPIPAALDRRIAAMPKVELHVHLEGAMDADAVWAMAEFASHAVPSAAVWPSVVAAEAVAGSASRAASTASTRRDGTASPPGWQWGAATLCNTRAPTGMRGGAVST